MRRALIRTKAGGLTLKKTKTKGSRRTISLPVFSVEALRRLRESRESWPAEWTVGQNRLPIHVIYRADAALGPATRWLVDRLKSEMEASDVVVSTPRAPRLAAV